MTTERDEIAARWLPQTDGLFGPGEEALNIELSLAVADFVISERARLFAEPSEGMVERMTEWLAMFSNGPVTFEEARAALRALGETLR